MQTHRPHNIGAIPILVKSRCLLLLLISTLLILLIIPALTQGDVGFEPQFQLDKLQAAGSARPNSVEHVQEPAVPSVDCSQTAPAMPITPMMTMEPIATQAVPAQYLATIGVKGERRYTNVTSMFNKLSAERTARGLRALTLNPAYVEPSMFIAAELSVDFDDYWCLRPNGEDFFDIYPAPWTGMAYAYINASPAQNVINMWMSDYWTQQILMDPAARSVGIGCFRLNGFYYWVVFLSSATSTNATLPANKTVVAPVQMITDFLSLTASPKTATITETKTTKVSAIANVPNWKKLPVENSYMAFHSWNPDIAKISSSGTVTGVAPGSAKVFIYPKDNEWIDCMSTITVSPIKYTIKFYNGTTLVTSRSIARGGKLPLSVAPAKTGYDFVGWYSAASGGTLVETATKNQSVYARYKAKVYTVTFYNGNDLVDTVKISYNKAPIAGPKKTGYTFSGWYTAKSGGTKVTKITKSQTLYARFTINQYTTKYYNGSTLVKTTKTNYNTNLMAGPAKTGYTFVGWFNAKTGGTQYTKVTGNRTLYARYQIKYYTVKYYNGSTLIDTASVKYKGAPMAGPAKTGYSFSGWYTAASGGTKVTSITKSQSLYARYKIKQYTTTYYDGTKLLKTVKANYNTKLMAGPAKSGYRFDGWYTAKTGGTKITNFTANRSVYARYVQQVTVSYFTEYGALIVKETVDINSTPNDANQPGAPVPGMTFVGWFSDMTDGVQVTVLNKTMNVFSRYQ
jgi:uncharacterized repeat protein (TIGR02543 family)